MIFETFSSFSHKNVIFRLWNKNTTAAEKPSTLMFQRVQTPLEIEGELKNLENFSAPYSNLLKKLLQ